MRQQIRIYEYRRSGRYCAPGASNSRNEWARRRLASLWHASWRSLCIACGSKKKTSTLGASRNLRPQLRVRPRRRRLLAEDVGQVSPCPSQYGLDASTRSQLGRPNLTGPQHGASLTTDSGQKRGPGSSKATAGAFNIPAMLPGSLGSMEARTLRRGRTIAPMAPGGEARTEKWRLTGRIGLQKGWTPGG